MDKEKIILLFSDLEGTILRESDGNYDDEMMYRFLSQIDRLQQLTDASVNIHLVSPVYKETMEKIIDRMDKNISSYNTLHKDGKRIPFIEGGTSTPEIQMSGDEFLGDKVVPLKMPIDSRNFDSSRYGKANYVRTWCSVYEENKEKDLIMRIYCGNGQNDLSAMSYIKSKKGGFVVCPNNSRQLAKKQADFVSPKTDLGGITEGLKGINNEIEKRLVPESKAEEDKKEKQL